MNLTERLNPLNYLPVEFVMQLQMACHQPKSYNHPIAINHLLDSLDVAQALVIHVNYLLGHDRLAQHILIAAENSRYFTTSDSNFTPAGNLFLIEEYSFN